MPDLRTVQEDRERNREKGKPAEMQGRKALEPGMRSERMDMVVRLQSF